MQAGIRLHIASYNEGKLDRSRQGVEGQAANK